jgi:hypothetical protein
MSNILQDMMGMLSRKKQVIPKKDDFITVARYNTVQEKMKPNPKVQTELITIDSLKTFVASTGASGSFTAGDQVVTVENGLIISII